jgi:hypothetical protein
VALFIQIQNWLPLVCNTSTMLFLTVMAAPVPPGRTSPLRVWEAIWLTSVRRVTLPRAQTERVLAAMMPLVCVMAPAEARRTTEEVVPLALTVVAATSCLSILPTH